MRRFSPILLITTCSAIGQQWEDLTDFPGTARDDAAAFSISERAYFGTGMEVGWGLTNDWWKYDFTTPGQYMTPVPSLPATPRQYCSTFQEVGAGYLFGGLDANGPLNEMWQFSEGPNSWTQRASLPGAGRYACATFNTWNLLYVVGGMLAGGIPTNECWSYDRNTDLWTEVAPFPGIARHRASSFSSSVSGYVVGGADSAFNALSDAWRYDQVSDQWLPIAPLPEARYGADAISPEQTLVGGVSNDSTFHANAFQYDWTLDSWTDLGDVLPHGIRGGAICHTGGGYDFIVYGLGIDSTLTRRQELYHTGYVFGITENGAGSIDLVPNPGVDRFSVLGLRPDAVVVTISDAQGRLLMTTSETTVDASSLMSGCISSGSKPPEVATTTPAGSSSDLPLLPLASAHPKPEAPWTVANSFLIVAVHVQRWLRYRRSQHLRVVEARRHSRWNQQRAPAPSMYR